MTKQFMRALTSGVAAVVLFVGAAANATPLPLDSFTTIFGQLPGPTPSAAAPGDLAPDVGIFPSDDALGPIANFSDFSVQNLNQDLLGGSANEGQIVFFQNGAFYVGGAGPAAANPLTAQGDANLGGPQVNNRAYGVFGTGRSDFTFLPGAVTSIELQARGTADGLTIGANPALGHSLPENSPLADADATILVYTDVGLEVTFPVGNVDFDNVNPFSVDVSSLAGSSITRVSLINEGPLNSAIVLGELTVSTIGINPDGFLVPEPASLALLSLVGGVLVVRRRR